MKNIPLEQVLYAARGARGSGWHEYSNMFVMSRIDEGFSSDKRVVTRFVGNGKKELRVINEVIQQMGWVTFVSNTQLEITGWLSGDGPCMKGMLSVSISDTTANLAVLGDKDTCEKMAGWFTEKYPAFGSLITTVEAIGERGALEKSVSYLNNTNMLKAHQAFYPWLGVSLEEYFDAYLDSDESILVMFGDPGLGKSTFLRALIAHRNSKAWLAYNREVVESPRVVSAFFRSSATILAYEDIDAHLKSRESGNTLMATILNASEGIMQHPGKKIAFSTNLPSIDRIDSALLRVGRCFDILPFRLLTSEEAVAARAAAQLPPEDFSSKDNWSLAEILAKRSTAQQTVNRFGKKIGFN